MTTYQVSLDKKRRLTLPTALLKDSGLAKAEDLVAYTDGAGRVVFAARSELLSHVQGVFRAARRNSQGGDPLEGLRASRAADAQREDSRLAGDDGSPGVEPKNNQRTEARRSRRRSDRAAASSSSTAPPAKHPRSPRKNTAGTEVNGPAVRQWARKQGLAVSSRGRIPASVVEQYRAAHR